MTIVATRAISKTKTTATTTTIKKINTIKDRNR